MKKKIVILGSTSSIGKSLLSIVEKDKKNFEVELLTANTNFKDLISQAKKFSVKNVIITDLRSFKKTKLICKNKNINVFQNFESLKKILPKKVDYVMSSISGIGGMLPTFKIIKHTKLIAIANKEAIVCGWPLIKKELKRNKTKFIPVDSEHFSISEILNNSDPATIDEVYITASGGPFLNFSKSKLSKVSVKEALNHPNWKMGKKISIDSATMMNKVFEVIEAKNIFELNYKKIYILIHSKSYIHALIKFNNGQIKFLAHEADMKIPIHNSLYANSKKKIYTENLNLDVLNNLNFQKINRKMFPLIKILNSLPKINSLYETALVTINDYFVSKFLQNKIKFIQLVNLIYKYSNKSYFTKLKKKSVKNINEIHKTRKYVNEILNNSGI
tara:strand:+ start:1891 stop:3054 length:1164 start_codon:yes stop_codon:yes gene_type:complete